MSPEKQRIVIAGVCGWSSIYYPMAHYPEPYGNCPDGGRNFPVPNYLGDKSAMQEARQTKWNDVRFRAKYAAVLHEICGFEPCGTLNASAEQEAKAFLIACGQWEVN